MPITIRDVQDRFDETLRRKGTPHRTPDFRKLNKEFGPDTPVRGCLWFIEKCNAGRVGLLERWEFKGEKNGLRFSFWADLAPPLIESTKAPAAVTP